MLYGIAQLVAEVRSGGMRATRAAARLMTIMIDEPHRLGELLVGSHDWPEPRLVLGITGAPGSGKSTLTDQVASEYRRRYPARKLGIVAVDPSSPFTGGALLGDRVRMMRHATDPQVFIRSLASRGRLGGLALGAKGVVRVMGLLGCDVVLVETVGVGQSEVEIAQNADVVMVVLAPGQGDSIQMLKAGLMEAGEVFVVNKADRDGAQHLHQQLLASLGLAQMARIELKSADDTAVTCLPLSQGHHARDGKGGSTSPAAVAATPVFLCSAQGGIGIAELVDGLEQLTETHATDWRDKRRQQVTVEVREAIYQRLRLRVEPLLEGADFPEFASEHVISGESTIDAMVDALLNAAPRESAGNSAGACGVSVETFHPTPTNC